MAQLVDDKTLTSSLQLVNKYVSPFNAVTLFALSALDLFEPTLAKSTSKAIALVVGLLIIAVLYRLYAARARKTELGSDSSVIGIFLRDRANIMAIGLLLVALFLCWYNAANASGTDQSAVKSRGALADNIPGLKAIQTSLLGIQGDVLSIKENTIKINSALNPTDARGKLKVLGYGLDDESKARAIEACDLEALKLYVAANEPLPLATPVMMSRGGSNLEKPIMAKNPKFPKVLDLLAASSADLDRRYILTFTQAETGEIPQYSELRASLPKMQQLGLITPSVVKANALTLAVWSDNQPVVEKLLSLGASPDVGVDALLPESKNGLMTGELVTKQIASARSEAQRLARHSFEGKK